MDTYKPSIGGLRLRNDLQVAHYPAIIAMRSDRSIISEKGEVVMATSRLWMKLMALGLLCMLITSCAGGRGPVAQPTATSAPAPTAAPAQPQPTTAVEQPQPTNAPAATPTIAQPSGEPIKIGLVSPFSGPLGILGQWMQISAQAEVERINAEGGLLGRPVVLVARDDELNPAKTVEIVREFIEREKVSMIIGPSLTAFALATKDLVTQNKTIQFLPTVSGMAALKDAPYTFRTLESIQLQMNEIARYLGSSGATKVGMVVLDDATGAEYIALLPEAVKTAGMTYVGHELFRNDDQDLTTQVLKVRELGADALVVGTGNSAQAAKVIIAARQIGWNVTLIGVSGLESTLLGQLVGDALDSVVFVNTFRGYQAGIPEADMPAGYMRHIKAALKLDTIPLPDQRDLSRVGMSTSTADAIYIWAEAVKRAGTLDSDAVKAEIEKTNIPEDESPSGGNLIISAENHEAYREGSLFFYQWRKLDNGQFRYTTVTR
ncbi:ABC transporter substrate-binding protein [Roseiflexus sp.]|uniref:ABC transporter substrate-binding protein n=1 Tax=Roseiflexus sp. TaxID=2562120 RepID=UPI00398B1F0F